MKRKKLKVCVFTAGRSDYFLLKPLLEKIKESNECVLKLVAGSMHASKEFGNTYKCLEDDGFHIDYQMRCFEKIEDNKAALFSMSKDLEQYSEFFPEMKPDFCILLGDRYEVLAFAIACHILRIPIAHIHGGELSYGSFDDASRHAITKLAKIHFPAAEVYRNRIIQMGEQPDTVMNVGALAVENIQRAKDLSIEKISQKLNIQLQNKYFLVTLHPETDRIKDDRANVSILAEALKNFPEYDVIWTISNADPNGCYINELISKMKGFHLVDNLGDMYIPVMKQASAVIGNSSSGLIEAPIVGTPTVNIGNRQDGRMRCHSIFDCLFDSKLIYQSIGLCLKDDYSVPEHPYGFGSTSTRIMESLTRYNFNKCKEFHHLTLKRII